MKPSSVLALVLVHALSGPALSFLLAPSWPLPTREQQRRYALTVQRLLKPRSPSIVQPVASPPPSFGGGASALPVRPWRGMKSRWGAPKRVNTEGFALSNRKCLYSGITGRSHACSGRDGTHGHVERSRPFAVRPAEPLSVLDATLPCTV